MLTSDSLLPAGPHLKPQGSSLSHPPLSRSRPNLLPAPLLSTPLCVCCRQACPCYSLSVKMMNSLLPVTAGAVGLGEAGWERSAQRRPGRDLGVGFGCPGDAHVEDPHATSVRTQSWGWCSIGNILTMLGPGRKMVRPLSPRAHLVMAEDRGSFTARLWLHGSVSNFGPQQNHSGWSNGREKALAGLASSILPPPTHTPPRRLKMLSLLYLELSKFLRTVRMKAYLCVLVQFWVDLVVRTVHTQVIHS